VSTGDKTGFHFIEDPLCVSLYFSLRNVKEGMILWCALKFLLEFLGYGRFGNHASSAQSLFHGQVMNVHFESIELAVRMSKSLPVAFRK
jgi:hypothetical protein